MAPVGKKCQHYLRSKLYDSAFSKIVENKFPSFNIAWKKMSSENVFPETNVSRYKLWFTWLDLVLLMWTCSLKANGHFLWRCCHWVISCCLDHHPRGDPCGSQLVLGMCASKKALHSLFSSMYCLVCMCHVHSVPWAAQTWFQPPWEHALHTPHLGDGGVSLGGAEISRNLQSEESIVHIFGSTQKSWPFSSLFLKLYQHNSMLGRLCQCCPGQAWQIQLRRLFCVVFVPSRTSSGEAYHSCLGNRCLARGLLTSLEGLCSSSQHPSSAPGIPVSWAPDS